MLLLAQACLAFSLLVLVISPLHGLNQRSNKFFIFVTLFVTGKNYCIISKLSKKYYDCILIDHGPRHSKKEILMQDFSVYFYKSFTVYIYE